MIHFKNLHDSNELFFYDYINKFDNVLKYGWFVLNSFAKKYEEEFANYNENKFKSTLLFLPFEKSNSVKLLK